MDNEQLVNQYRDLMQTALTPRERFRVTADFLAGVFAVQTDEVAIFSCDDSRETLVFEWPDSLKTVGSIPLNAHRCLVSKCAVEKRGALDNHFASTPHLQMFEQFLSDRNKRIPIQKIISVPVLSGSTVKGVVQIARKGSDRSAAGADFTTADLNILEGLASELSRHFSM